MDVFRPANPTLSRYKDNKQGVAQGRARDRSVILFPIEQRESCSAVPFIVRRTVDVRVFVRNFETYRMYVVGKDIQGINGVVTISSG